MAKLQQPKFVFMGGGLRPWADATLHVGCEAVTRNVNVFEGLKGYWQASGNFGIVQLRKHYERLHRSARLLRHSLRNVALTRTAMPSPSSPRH